MFQIFKKKIPKEDQQEVNIVKGSTLEWFSYKRDFSSYGKSVHNAKVFINKQSLNEFKKQLEECAKFINSEVYITIKENDN
jgi:hypothetical protein